MEKFGTFGQLKYERPDFEALKAYYEKLGLLVTAKGEDKLEDTTSNVAKALGLEV